MRGNGETAALVNDIAHFARGLSFQIGQLGADTKQMTVRGSYFDSRKNEKIVDWHAIKSHQAFLEQVIDRVTCVVIGDGDPVQTFGARRGDQIFRAGNSITGKKRMRMQIDIKRHGDRSGNRYTSSSTRMSASASLCVFKRLNW